MNKFIGIFNDSECSQKNLDAIKKSFEDCGNGYHSLNLPKVSIFCSKENHNFIYQDKTSGDILFIFGNITKINKDDVTEDQSVNEVAKRIYDLYKKEGDDFIHKIYGSYCIHFIDYLNKEFVAYRDHIGLRPLYYSKKVDKLYFSSEISSLIKINAFGKKLNRKRVVHFITHTVGQESETFFESIFRLPASRMLKFSGGGIITKKINFFGLKDLNQELGTQVKTLKFKIETAIKSLFRKQKSTASKISGGLDSSSISSVLAAKNNEVTFITGVYKFNSKEDFRKTDEFEYVQDFRRKYKVNINQIIFKENNDINPFIYDEDDDEPNFIMNRYFDIKFLSYLKEHKIECVFDGFDGDSVITYGTNYLYDLGKQFKFKELFKLKNQLENAGSIKRISNLRFLIRFGIAVHFPSALKSLIDKIRSRKTREEKNYEVLTNDVKRNFSLKSLNKDLDITKKSYINSKEIHLRVMEWPLWGIILEHNFKESNKYGVEEVFPFLDRDVIQYSLNIDTKYKLREGKKRYILREAMKDFLPQNIYERKGKSDLSPAIDNFFSSLKQKREYLDLLTSTQSPINGLLDKNQIKKIYSNMDKADNQLLMNIISLARWMKKHNFHWK